MRVSLNMNGELGRRLSMNCDGRMIVQLKPDLVVEIDLRCSSTLYLDVKAGPGGEDRPMSTEL